MGWLLSLLGSVFTGSFVNAALALGDKFLSAYLKAKDVDLEKYRYRTDEEKELILAAVAYEQAKIGPVRDVVLAAMVHPIWWVAWSLFVIPPGIYNAGIYLVSIFPGLNYTIDRVPPVQEAWALLGLQWIFGLQVATGAVAGVTKAVTDAIAKK